MSKNPSELRKSLNQTLLLRKNNIECPVALEIMFDPVSLNGCGHTIDATSLMKLVRSTQICPTCREPFTNALRSISLRNIIDDFLEDNPKYYNDVNFDEVSLMDYIVDPLLKGTMPPDRVLKVLSHKKIEEGSLLDIILTEEGTLKGCPMVFALLCTDPGKEILKKHPSYLSKITIKTLNYVVEEGPYKGTSVAFLLAITFPNGVLFDEKYKDLLSQVNAKSFNSIVKFSPYKGLTLALCFISDIKGLELLEKHTKLMSQISNEALNSIVEDGDFKGMSIPYCLIASTERLSFLEKYVNLIPKISMKTLNAKIEPLNNWSLVEYLQSNSLFDSLLKTYPVLQGKIIDENKESEEQDERIVGVYRLKP